MLQRLYGSSLQSLRGCLLGLAQHAPAVQAAMGQQLLQAGDPPAYAELLEAGLAVLPSTAPSLPATLTLQQESSQAEVGQRKVGCRDGGEDRRTLPFPSRVLLPHLTPVPPAFAGGHARWCCAQWMCWCAQRRTGTC